MTATLRNVGVTPRPEHPGWPQRRGGHGPGSPPGLSAPAAAAAAPPRRYPAAGKQFKAWNLKGLEHRTQTATALAPDRGRSAAVQGADVSLQQTFGCMDAPNNLCEDWRAILMGQSHWRQAAQDAKGGSLEGFQLPSDSPGVPPLLVAEAACSSDNPHSRCGVHSAGDAREVTLQIELYDPSRTRGTCSRCRIPRSMRECATSSWSGPRAASRPASARWNSGAALSGAPTWAVHTDK